MAYVFGLTSPQNPCFPEEINLVIQKSFFDHMCEVSISEVIDIVGIGKLNEMSKVPDLSNKMNNGKANNFSENSSFEDIFMNEIEGVTDLLRPLILKILENSYKKVYGCNPKKEEVLSSDAPQKIVNLINESFRLKKIGKELSFLEIPATIHTGMRIEKYRKYKKNDSFDFWHAEAALPYFDAFLTENSLSHLLKRNDLKLDKKYNCEVISNLSEAVQFVRELFNE
jgi:hypothetical protein